ncbi:MAG: BamA/TamA family outer membrane protein [Candidatus Aminicenantes bacterium]|nr:BamA/TamA family outer membrane protein [Candidatus Aminicenantes bacterium]
MKHSVPFNLVKLMGGVVFTLVLVFYLVPNVEGFVFDTPQKTKKIVAGEEYKASGFHKFLLGKNYRSLWAVPIEVDVLDFQSFAGGLRPVMRVGGMQTLGLALKGADGRSYTFRGIDKDPTSFLPQSFQDTLADRLIKDQTAAAHPAGAIVVPPIAEAAGILHNVPELVIMPDDPRLGEFRDAFANVLGTIEEYPSPALDSHPGTFGATEILSSVEMWDRRLADPENHIDSRAFLRARLVDILLGDWDRHRNQWRWAKIPYTPGWQPIPEDRDQVFASYEGLVLTWVRWRNPQLIKFKGSYPGIEGMTWNGREMDRILLTDLELPVWEEIARDVQSRVTDDVIEKAVHRMPKEYYDLSGEEIKRSLKQRRDKLQNAAAKFYRHLAGEVNVHCTNRDDWVEVQRIDNGDVDVKVSLSVDGKMAGDYYFQRRFHPKETKEIRIYLHNGNNFVVTSGGRLHETKVRVISGDGQDFVDDSEGGGLYFSDMAGNSRMIRGPGSKHDTSPYEPPPGEDPDNTLLEHRDWGRRTAPQVYPGFSSDIGLFLGGGLISTGYGFRYVPYSDSHKILAGYATSAQSGIFDYRGDFRKPNSSLFSTFSVLVSGLEFLRFYGFGNETSADETDDFYKIRQRMISIFPALHYMFSPSFEIYGGLQIKYNAAKDDPDTLLGTIQPYGYANFGQVGFRLGFNWDTRNPLKASNPGFRIDVEGFVYPKAATVESTFSGVEGNAAAYISLTKPLILALSIGGKKLFGTIPYTEAAYIGGNSTVRGFAKNRFAGDSSLYGRLELRLILGKAIFVIPGEYGIFGLTDIGRVFVKGESSNKWHPAYGGGVFFSVLDLATVFSLAVAVSEEWTAVYFKAGFSF